MDWKNVQTFIQITLQIQYGLKTAKKLLNNTNQNKYLFTSFALFIQSFVPIDSYFLYEIT